MAEVMASAQEVANNAVTNENEARAIANKDSPDEVTTPDSVYDTSLEQYPLCEALSDGSTSEVTCIPTSNTARLVARISHLVEEKKKEPVSRSGSTSPDTTSTSSATSSSTVTLGAATSRTNIITKDNAIAWSLNLLNTPATSACNIIENSPPTRGESDDKVDRKSNSHKKASGSSSSPSVEFKNHPGNGGDGSNDPDSSVV
jgi:hypothetical protein